MIRLLIIGLSLFFFTSLLGQENDALTWKAHKKQAEELVSKRQYAKAAIALENAYALKTQRGDLLKSAAEYFMLERDFKNAARVLATIVDNPKYKSAKLDYAYSLKQSNQYEEAMLVFAALLENSKSQNPKLEAKINREIMGCQFALDQLEGYDVKPYGIDIAQLDYTINSEKSEFAPFYVSDTKLYYSTLEDGNAKIKSSMWRDGDWASGIEAKGFGAFKNKHFCNAVVSPDDNEMFFTICDEDQVWGGLSSRCDIYTSTKKGKAWGQPKKLNANINFDGATNTQPFVITTADRQQLYFASNRPGGQGGMDLWVATRSLDAKRTDFSEPTNLGPNINTPDNEITPFFDVLDGVLYFSSDGHLTMGGFDIFRAVGEGFSWSPAENIGLPINSGSDEKYYTTAGSSTEGYFVSNREFGDTKTSTTHEDIFTFNILPPHFFVEGSVMDNQDLNWVDDAQVYLYELKEKTQDRRLLSTKKAKGGHYNFRLLANRNYQLGVEANGYSPNIEFVNTKNENLFVQEKNIKLFKAESEGAIASVDDILPSDVPAVAPTATLDSPIKETKNMETDMTESKAMADTSVKEPFVIGAPDDVVTEPAKEVVNEITEVVEEVKEPFVIGTPDVVVAEPTQEALNQVAEIVEAVREEKVEMVKEPFVIGAQTTDESEGVKETVVENTKTIIATVAESTLAPSATPQPSISTTNTVASTKTNTSSTVVASPTRSAESYIANTITSEGASSSTQTYASASNSYASNSDANFVAKGNAKVPSGTGIYTYDEYNNKFNKQGGTIAYKSNTSTYVEPSTSYSKPTKVSTPSKAAVIYDAPSSNMIVGRSYKVQLITVEYHNPSNRRYDGVRNLGLKMVTEYIQAKGWTRVLMGSFKTEAEANASLDNARKSGFTRAFIVEYKDGQRKGRVRK